MKGLRTNPAGAGTQVLRRREMLGAVGLLAAGLGGSALTGSTVAAEDANESVEDRTSTIRIRKLTPTVCRDRVFVKVETNHGIFGWGEVKGVIPAVAATLARSMFQLIDGENPTRIEHIWQTLYRAERNQRGGAFMLHSIAGIEMALWDIAG